MHNNACGCLNTVQTSPSETYTTTYSYDAASRKDGVVFPSGYAVKYHYNGIGHFESITDTHGHELYRTVKTTAMGQTERFVMGGNMVSKREYHAEKQTLTHILTANGENILQDLWYDYDGFGNLAVRKDTLRDLEERFTYDHLNRLTGIRLNGSPTGDMGYDPYGRMKDKVADGSRVFFSAVYDLTSKPHAIDAAKTLPGVFPAERQRIDYTCFDKVKTIEEGDKTLEYTYGYDRQRTGMTEHANGVVRTKRYAGGCEFVTRTENDTTTQVVYTFLTGPTGVFAVVEKSNGEENVHYVLKDHLGSWTTITDADGVVEHEQSFDAWGNMRDPDSWTGTVAQQPMFDRGFTGHEHMAAFGLINMNGRCYDPLTSCFLSVDAYVQSPDNSQSFNRYSYCQNNPLRYTDPSGWQMVGGMRPRHQGFYDKWGDYYSCPIYRPRDFGLLQLSDVNPDIAWMEANEMHGGSSFGSNYTVDGATTQGGWYRDANGKMQWSPTISSQTELTNSGIDGVFLGHTYTDLVNKTYYSLLGYEVDMTIQNGLAGKLAPLIDNAIENLILFEIDEIAYYNWISSTEPSHAYTDFGLAIAYDASKGGVNQYDFDIGFAICHFSVFSNPTSMLARLEHIDFDKDIDSNSGFGFVNWSDGYNLNFISKINQISTNPRTIRTLTITFTSGNSWVDFQNRYKTVRGY